MLKKSRWIIVVSFAMSLAVSASAEKLVEKKYFFDIRADGYVSERVETAWILGLTARYHRVTSHGGHLGVSLGIQSGHDDGKVYAKPNIYQIGLPVIVAFGYLSIDVGPVLAHGPFSADQASGESRRALRIGVSVGAAISMNSPLYIEARLRQLASDRTITGGFGYQWSVEDFPFEPHLREFGRHLLNLRSTPTDHTFELGYAVLFDENVRTGGLKIGYDYRLWGRLLTGLTVCLMAPDSDGELGSQERWVGSLGLPLTLRAGGFGLVVEPQLVYGPYKNKKEQSGGYLWPADQVVTSDGATSVDFASIGGFSDKVVSNTTFGIGVGMEFYAAPNWTVRLGTQSTRTETISTERNTFQLFDGPVLLGTPGKRSTLEGPWPNFQTARTRHAWSNGVTLGVNYQFGW